MGTDTSPRRGISYFHSDRVLQSFLYTRLSKQEMNVSSKHILYTNALTYTIPTTEPGELYLRSAIRLRVSRCTANNVCDCDQILSFRGNRYESETRYQLLPFRPSDQPNEVQLDIASLLNPGTRFFLSVETRRYNYNRVYGHITQHLSTCCIRSGSGTASTSWTIHSRAWPPFL